MIVLATIIIYCDFITEVVLYNMYNHAFMLLSITVQGSKDGSTKQHTDKGRDDKYKGHPYSPTLLYIEVIGGVPVYPDLWSSQQLKGEAIPECKRKVMVKSIPRMTYTECQAFTSYYFESTIKDVMPKPVHNKIL